MAVDAALQSGKAEYKSVTVSLDATAEEFIDFYFDDPTRPTWVCCAMTEHDAALMPCLQRLHSAMTASAPRPVSPIETVPSRWRAPWIRRPSSLHMRTAPLTDTCCIPAQDQMVTEYDVVENGSPADRCQVTCPAATNPYLVIVHQDPIRHVV